MSHHYDDENFDEYNEEVNEEIFHEDENVEEMMYRQGGEQMDMHGQQVKFFFFFNIIISRIGKF